MEKFRKILGIICLLSAVGMAAFWMKQYLPTLQEYKESKDYYKDITDDNKKDPDPATEEEVNKWLLSLGIDKTFRKKSVIQIDSDAMLERNSDYLGWIYIPDTTISYPVVMSHDNQDYLHQSFDKEYLYAGTIFMDCRCYDGVTNKHSVLYGHNMRDGSMFAGIRNFVDQKYVEEHPYFWFITPEYRLLYKVFSATVSSPYDDTVFGVTYDSIDDFRESMEDIANRSQVKTDTVPTKDDFVMTLSTCTNDGSSRFTLHGVLLGAMREGLSGN